VFEEDGRGELRVDGVVVRYEVGVREAGLLFYQDGRFTTLRMVEAAGKE